VLRELGYGENAINKMIEGCTVRAMS